MNSTVKKPAFKVIGIGVRTTNQNLQAMSDIGALWGRFFEERVMSKIPHQISSDIYEVFTDYESDCMGPYQTIIGCMVHDSASAPAGMIEVTIPAQTYKTVLAKGKLPDAIGAAWKTIWTDTKLPRAYLADFDVYGEKSQDPSDGEVNIFVGIK